MNEIDWDRELAVAQFNLAIEELKQVIARIAAAFNEIIGDVIRKIRELIESVNSVFDPLPATRHPFKVKEPRYRYPQNYVHYNKPIKPLHGRRGNR